MNLLVLAQVPRLYLMSLSGKGVFTLDKGEAQDGHDHSHGDETIGEIKGGPVVSVPVKVEKIDDLSVYDTIDQISYGPAEDEGHKGQ